MSKLVNIQILRAVAALMVVVYHCGMEMAEVAQRAGGAMPFDFYPWGTGVEIFFAISGFIMAVTAGDQFGQPGAAMDFLRRRLVRIIPLYWALTLVMLAASIALPQLMKVPLTDPAYPVASLLFWPMQRATGEIRPLLTQGWTLNLELLFYGLFALGMMLPLRRGLLLVAGVLTALMAAKIAFGPQLPVPLRFWGDPVVIGFLLGIGIGLLWRAGVRLPAWSALFVGVVGFLGVFGFETHGLDETALATRLLLVIPAALVVAAAALGPQLGEGRAVGWGVTLGDASYSLYLVHPFVTRPIRLVWASQALPLWWLLPVGLVASVLVSVLVWRFLEIPLTRAAGRLVAGSGRGRPAWVGGAPRIAR